MPNALVDGRAYWASSSGGAAGRDGGDRHTPSSSSYGSANPSDQSGSVFGDEDDTVLQEHLVRVQQALIQSVDRQMSTIEERLEETSEELRHSTAIRTDMGVALFESQKSIKQLDGDLQTMKARLDEMEGERRAKDVEASKMRKDKRECEKKNDFMEKEIRTLRARLSCAGVEMARMQEAVGAMNCNMKTHAKIAEKLDRDVNYYKEKLEDVGQQDSNLKKKLSKTMREKENLRMQLQLQEKETNHSEASVQILIKELEKTENLNQQMRRTWEDGMIALTNRDRVLEKVARKYENASADAITMENKARGLDKVNKQLMTMNNMLFTEKEKVREKLSQKEYTANKLKDEKRLLERENFIQRKETKELEREIDAAEKKLKVSELTVDIKSKIAGEAVHSMKTMKEELYLTKKHANEMNVNAEAQLKRTVEQHERQSKHDEARLVMLHNSNYEVLLKCREKESQAKILKEENSSLENRFSSLNDHYHNLTKKYNCTRDEVDRKQYVVDTLRNKLGHVDYDAKTRPLENTIKGLQKDMRGKNNECEDLKSKWLKTQNEFVHADKKKQKLEEEAKYSALKIDTMELIQKQTNNEVEKMKKEALQQKKDMIGTQLELNQLQPLVSELRQKNQFLQAKLGESRLDVRAREIDLKTENSDLKMELRLLRQERANMKKQRASEDKNSMVVESKMTTTKENLAKTKEQNRKLSKENHKLSLENRRLRKALDGSTQSFIEWASTVPATVEHHRQMAHEEIQKRRRTTIALDNHISDDSMEGQKLKILRLSKQVEYLKEELIASKKREDQSKATAEHARQRKHVAKENVRLLEQKYAFAKEKIESVIARCRIAEALAASFEIQLKNVNPNVVVDYGYRPKLSPSSILLNAFNTILNEVSAHEKAVKIYTRNEAFIPIY
eukprot:Nk52_evm5s2630 gene=Nk52_evmTU5s2630